MRPVLLAMLVMTGWPAAAAEAPWKVGHFYAAASVDGRSVAFDALLKLQLRKDKVGAAAVDACFALDDLATLSDRVQLPLAVAGDALSGSGTTELSHRNAALMLKLSAKAGQMRVAGTLTVEKTVIAIESEAFALEAEASPAVAEPEQPGAAALTSLNGLTVLFRPDSARAVLDLLRAKSARVDSSGLLPSCGDLRAEQQGVGVLVAPARREDLRQALVAIPGVSVRADTWDRPDTAVRIAAAAEGGPSEAEIAETVAQAVEAAAGGRRVGAVASDPVTGAHAVEVRGRSDSAARLGLTQAVTVRYAVGRAEGGRYWHVLLKEVSNRLVDDATPLLALGEQDALARQEEDGLGLRKDVLSRRILERLAALRGGEVRDEETQTWRAPSGAAGNGR